MTETATTYCKTCGHSKDDHDLNMHLDPAHHTRAREDAAHGHGACHDMSYGDHPCICVEFLSWT